VNPCGARYVVDNNTLTQLTTEQRASGFFQRYALIPSEVLSEASSLHDLEQLRKNEYRTTPSVLRWLKEVLRTVNTRDTRLVDLYANQGNADPLLIACALDGREQDSRYILRPDWIVVTGDKAVRSKARDFDLPVISNSEFGARINNSGEMEASQASS